MPPGGGCTAKYNEYAAADGIPHEELGTGILRETEPFWAKSPSSAGGPKSPVNPLAGRVSISRHGTIAT